MTPVRILATVREDRIAPPFEGLPLMPLFVT